MCEQAHQQRPLDLGSRRLEGLTGLLNGDAHVHIVSTQRRPTLRFLNGFVILFVHSGTGIASGVRYNQGTGAVTDASRAYRIDLLAGSER